jgi:hypothetical protein
MEVCLDQDFEDDGKSHGGTLGSRRSLVERRQHCLGGDRALVAFVRRVNAATQGTEAVTFYPLPPLQFSKGLPLPVSMTDGACCRRDDGFLQRWRRLS